MVFRKAFQSQNLNQIFNLNNDEKKKTFEMTSSNFEGNLEKDIF